MATAAAVAGRARVHPAVIARSGSDEAIQLTMPRYELLRRACHRARVRATRWLAMTVYCVIAALGRLLP